MLIYLIRGERVAVPPEVEARGAEACEQFYFAQSKLREPVVDEESDE